MNRPLFLPLVLGFLLILCPRIVFAQNNILFVGNSFTHGQYAPLNVYNNANVHDGYSGATGGSGGVPGVFQKMASDLGYPCTVYIEAVSGQNLAYHYANESNIIGQSKWNTVVLQDYSTEPTDDTVDNPAGFNIASFNTATGQLKTLIRNANPNAKIVLYETWARPDLCRGTGYFPNLSAMLNQLHTNYYADNTTYGLNGVAPVGDAFALAIASGYAHGNLYDGPVDSVTDLKFSDGTFSLWYFYSVGNPEGYHPSIYGGYMAGAVFIAQLTGLDPRNIPTGPGSAAAGLGISSDDAAHMNLVAYQITAASLSIVSANSTTFAVGAPGSFTVMGTGWPTPTFTATGLPSWATLNSTTGVLSGTPPDTTGAPFAITLTATNASGSVTQNFTLNVSPPVTPVITNGPPPTTGSVGTFYNFTYQASGLPTPTFSVTTGALPPGLMLSSAGVLSGTPTVAGIYSGKVTASNGATLIPASSQVFSIAIQQAPIILGGQTASNLAPYGTAILGYSSSTTSAGTAFSHAGVTTTINDGIGTSSVDNFGGSGSYGYVGIKFASPLTLNVASLNLNMYIFADGGWFGPNNVSAQGVTGGATGGKLVAPALTAPTVQITTNGTSWSTVTTTNNYVTQMTGVAAANTISPTSTFTLTTPVTNIQGIRLIGKNGGTAGSPHGFIGVTQLKVLTQTLPSGTAGTAYTYTYGSVGYPVPTFTVTTGGLPPGLTLSTAGVISGTPATSGTFTGTIRASNGIGSPATTAFSIAIAPGAQVAPAITNTPNPAPTVGTSYNFTYTATGTPPPTFSLTSGALPPGLTLSSTGVISGTPTFQGYYTCVVTASNGVNPAATQSVSLKVSGTYSQWASHYGVGDATATPQNDGVSNLMKYFCDIRPDIPISKTDAAALPAAGMINVSGTTYLTLTYRCSAVVTVADVNLEIQTSSDLKNWSTVSPDLTQTLGTDPITGDPTVLEGVKINGQPRLFIRLNLTLP